MAEQNNSDQPGYYKIDKINLYTVNGITVDIRNQVDSVVLYEDLFSPFLSGILILDDTQDLIGSFGRFGFNALEIHISSPHQIEANNIAHVFHVYSITDFQFNGDRSISYRLNFISEEGIADLKTYQRQFKGKPEQIVSDIVSNFYSQNKKVNTDKTSNEIKFVSPYWSPSQIIDFVCSRSINNKDSSFLFYENRDGFNFRQLEQLSNSTEIVRTFQDSEYTGEDKSTQSNLAVQRDLGKLYSKILQQRLDSVYDYLKDHEAGVIKSRLMVSDPTLKSFKTLFQNAISGNPQKLNKNHIYDQRTIDLSSQRHMLMTKFFSNYSIGESSNFQNVLSRITKIEQMKTYGLEIEVHGHLDYMVGKKIHCNFYRPAQISKNSGGGDDEIIDQNRSGFYLISAISHRFRNDGYFCTMQIIKDSTELA